MATRTRTLDLGSARANLAAMRAARKIKVADMATAAGLTVGSIKGFNGGKSSMPLDRFEQMLSALGARIVIVYEDTKEAS